MKKKVFKIGYYIVIGGIGAIALLLIVSFLPITGNYKFMTVLSGSMSPDIKTGSVVLIKPADNYKINDVITYKSASGKKEPITHRIIEMRVDRGNPVYITKGDVNNAADAREVKYQDVLGRVLVDVPYVGYAVAAAQKPWGFAALIIIPALLIISDEFRKIWRELVKLKKKHEPA